MINDNVFELFGVPVMRATDDVVALQQSLDESVAKANDIDANLGRGVVAPGIDQVTSSASEVARALGTANSTEALRAKAQQLKDVVDQNANALQDKAGEARARAQNLSARIETAVPVVVGRFDTSTDDIGDRLHLKRWTFDRKGKLL